MHVCVCVWNMYEIVFMYVCMYVGIRVPVRCYEGDQGGAAS
jgi:hypothetical protein